MLTRLFMLIVLLIMTLYGVPYNILAIALIVCLLATIVELFLSDMNIL